MVFLLLKLKDKHVPFNAVFISKSGFHLAKAKELKKKIKENKIKKTEQSVRNVQGIYLWELYRNPFRDIKILHQF